jgi:hypothetical protein
MLIRAFYQLTYMCMVYNYSEQIGYVVYIYV